MHRLNPYKYPRLFDQQYEYSGDIVKKWLVSGTETIMYTNRLNPNILDSLTNSINTVGTL